MRRASTTSIGGLRSTTGPRRDHRHDLSRSVRIDPGDGTWPLALGQESVRRKTQIRRQGCLQELFKDWTFIVKADRSLKLR